MSISRDEILTACWPILDGAHRHSSGVWGFMTAYQIWFLLLESNPNFCNRLRSECGNAVGSGGGDLDGPAKRIADALGHSQDRIETLYFDPRKTFFGDTCKTAIQASGQTCGLFRIRNQA
jgi:hypothetical protein